MIATGTDVKPIECVFFMRDVKSKNYFEQMLGRGTRTMDEDNLKRVTPSVTTAKTHFVVIDAIGVSKSQKTDARPPEKNRSIPTKDLLAAVLMGNKEEAIFSSLAGRLARINKELTPDENKQFEQLSGGKSVSQLIKALLNAHDPDLIDENARKKFYIQETKEPSTEQKAVAQDELIRKAGDILNGELNTFIEKLRQNHEQIIDRTNIDKVLFTGWDMSKKEQSEKFVSEFKDFIEQNKNEITALKILYNDPYHRKDITYKMINELFEKLKLNKPYLSSIRVYEAYSLFEKTKGVCPQRELCAIVSLIRHIAGIDKELTDYSYQVDLNFQKWVFNKQSGVLKFSKEQMEWLYLIKKHFSTSFHIDHDDLDMAPFDAKGGLAKMYDLFGNQMDNIINEMNEALVA